MFEPPLRSNFVRLCIAVVDKFRFQPNYSRISAKKYLVEYQPKNFTAARIFAKE